jgi:hypothetical protein
MNTELEWFLDNIRLQGVDGIHHEYSSQLDISSEIPQATQMLKENGIEGYVIKCYWCSCCKEYNSLYPYHVELIEE